MQTQTLGYPRIGRTASSSVRSRATGPESLDGRSLMAVLERTRSAAAGGVVEAGWITQREAGIDAIAVGGESLYDHVLDWSIRFGLIPERFRGWRARSARLQWHAPLGIPALEMTKWFDTNYHYLVPEVEADVTPVADFAGYLALTGRARAVLGAAGLCLSSRDRSRSRGRHTWWLHSRRCARQAAAVVPRAVHGPGASGCDRGPDPRSGPGPQWRLRARDDIERAYAGLADPGVRLNLVTYFDDLGDAYPWVANLPCDAPILTSAAWRDAVAHRGVWLACGQSVGSGCDRWQEHSEGTSCTVQEILSRLQALAAFQALARSGLALHRHCSTCLTARCPGDGPA